MPKKNNKLLILGIIALIIFIYAANQGWFKSTITIAGDTINQLENPPAQLPGITCSLSLSKSVITAGDLVTGTITDGRNTYCEGYGKMVGTTDWRKTSEGTTDLSGRATHSENFWVVGDFVFAAICDTNGNGFLDAQDCVTNEVSLKVNPGVAPVCVDSDGNDIFTFGHVDDLIAMVSYPDTCYDSNSVIEYVCNPLPSAMLPQNCPTTHECDGGRCILKPTHNVGDIIGGESGSGTMPVSGGVGFEFHDLTDFEVVPGGLRRLGARINTNWDYVNQDACFGFVVQEGMEWMFMDSNSVEWSSVDAYPQSHSVDLCPLDWDGTNLWFLEFWKTQNIPGCDIIYNWDVEIYVCE